MQTKCRRTKRNEHKMSQDFVLDTSWLTMSTGKKLQILLRPADHYKMKGVMNFNMISFQVRTQIPVVKDQTTFRLNIQVGAWEIILARESFKNDKNDLKLTKNITCGNFSLFHRFVHRIKVEWKLWLIFFLEIRISSKQNFYTSHYSSKIH